MGIREEAERIKKKLEESINLKVRLALFGQPGSGKSSIINKLVGRPRSLDTCFGSLSSSRGG